MITVSSCPRVRAASCSCCTLAPCRFAFAVRLRNGNENVTPTERFGASERKIFASERLNPPNKNDGDGGITTGGLMIGGRPSAVRVELSELSRKISCEFVSSVVLIAEFV